jgi:hypothetical protein
MKVRKRERRDSDTCARYASCDPGLFPRARVGATPYNGKSFAHALSTYSLSRYPPAPPLYQLPPQPAPAREAAPPPSAPFDTRACFRTTSLRLTRT